MGFPRPISSVFIAINGSEPVLVSYAELSRVRETGLIAAHRHKKTSSRNLVLNGKANIRGRIPISNNRNLLTAAVPRRICDILGIPFSMQT
jgi:hypothetical protein